MGRPQDGRVFYTVCDCCGLEFPSREAQTWTERTRARRLKILDAEAQPADRGQNPYNEYWVEHVHRVCPTCHADLMAGGKFRALHRNRSKMAVLGVVALLAVLIATLPITLPHVMSALNLLPRGR
jgi:hypothetical protein